MTMAREAALARFGGGLWLTEGGLETELVFHDGIDLPFFAAFTMLETAEGRSRLERFYSGLLDLAERLGVGFVMDSHTWRGSEGWGARMGLSAASVAAINAESVAFLKNIRAGRGAQAARIAVNGVIGPAGDAYAPDRYMTVAEARSYHGPQVAALAAAGVDLATVMTMTHVEEAIGVGVAAREAGLPFVCSFTVETDGNLPSGMALQEALARVDDATDGWPLWFGINCAHPDHFRARLSGSWVGRIGMLRANASRKSHAELEASETLDAGDPEELGRDYAALLSLLPGLRVIGGCCGTDLRHVAAVGHACCDRWRGAA
ncbi:MAG: homocysteine S-methyltransferase family protein [Gemmobacter sp.]